MEQRAVLNGDPLPGFGSPGQLGTNVPVIFSDYTPNQDQSITVNLGTTRLFNRVTLLTDANGSGRVPYYGTVVYGGTDPSTPNGLVFIPAGTISANAGSVITAPIAPTTAHYLRFDFGAPNQNSGSTIYGVQAQETTYQAQPSLSVASLGNVHVGATAGATITVTNTDVSTAQTPEQSLVVTNIATAAGSSANNRTIAPGTAAGFTGAAQLQITHVGANTGTVTLTYSSDGTAYGQGVTATGLTSTTTVSGVGYDYAATNLGATTVNLGATRVGGAALSGSTTVANTAAASGYAEKLNVGAGTASGEFSGAAATNGIAAGSGATLTFGLGSGTSGTFVGSQTLTMVSDGAGTSNLSTTASAARRST